MFLGWPNYIIRSCGMTFIPFIFYFLYLYGFKDGSISGPITLGLAREELIFHN